ncbi:hypothetical protein CPC08DRAFT_729330 [Agrocybe pediades]|nr:hypothetical protein CPC08DRAFT_729330 [Agrocybe pediades]
MELKHKSTQRHNNLQAEVKQVSDGSSEFDGLTAMGEYKKQDESEEHRGGDRFDCLDYRNWCVRYTQFYSEFERKCRSIPYRHPYQFGEQHYPKTEEGKNSSNTSSAGLASLSRPCSVPTPSSSPGPPVTRSSNRRGGLRLVGFACASFAVLIHGTALKLGLRLQNFLGIFKVLVLLFIVVTGWVALGGHLRDFETGVGFRTRRAVRVECACVIWSYIGFSNVNYALSEVKNPQRTVRIAGPLAIAVVTVLYVSAYIAHFSTATKEEITSGGRLVAALLFRDVYGPKAERALTVFVAMSDLGIVMSVTFSQGRVNQELGREGILPFSTFWGSNRPFNAPLVGLALHWAICHMAIFALPPATHTTSSSTSSRTLSPSSTPPSPSASYGWRSVLILAGHSHVLGRLRVRCFSGQ